MQFIRKIKNIILFCLLFHNEMICSQGLCIVAGDTTLVHYTDLIPDAYIVGYGPYNPPATYYLDINQDNQPDFSIVSWVSNTHTGSLAYSYISGVGQNEVLVNSSNNSIPDTLNNTDTICTSGAWKNKAYFADYNFILGDSADSYDHSEWNQLQNKYVGLKLVYPTYSIFGWVQIYSYSPGGYNYILIKNFGCGTIPISPSIIVYPNPSYGIMHINLPNYSSYEIKLFNDIGEIVYRSYGSQKIVDISAMPSGIYILRIETGDKIISEKIIKSIKPD